MMMLSGTTLATCSWSQECQASYQLERSFMSNPSRGLLLLHTL